MPSKPARICSCGRRVPSGTMCQCRRQARAEADALRPSSAQRGYDSDWRTLRAAFLKANPCCSEPGCSADATDADHVISVRERPDLRLDWNNLRPFCHPHHSRRTARDQGFAKGGRVQTLAQGGATAQGQQREYLSKSPVGNSGHGNGGLR